MKAKKRGKTNKFYKTNSMGISLIVLVITIIVIIILATAVIISVLDNNPLSEANKARFQSDRDNMQSIFTNTVAKVMAVNQGSIKVKPGKLNEVTNGVKNTIGVASYIVENAADNSKASGTITFDNKDNTETEYYTGKQLPIYKAGETKWYVDSEGLLLLEVGKQVYGEGNKEVEGNEGEKIEVDKDEYNALRLRVTQLEEENNKLKSELEKIKKEEEEKIAQSDNPMLQAWSTSSNGDFHSSEYKSKITKVVFSNLEKVPSTKIESWDVSSAKDKSIMAWVEDDGNNGYALTIAARNKMFANNYDNAIFYNFTNLQQVYNIQLLDISKAYSLEDMFRNCSSLKNLDLSCYKTYNVTSTARMFQNCQSLTYLIFSENFNFGDISGRTSMFENCSNLITTITESHSSRPSMQYSSTNMFRKAATISPSRIIINYYSELFVDGYIKEASGSNIVKGKRL